MNSTKLPSTAMNFLNLVEQSYHDLVVVEEKTIRSAENSGRACSDRG
jgi:hypothetical protein